MSTTCHQKAQSLGIAPCGGKQPPATHHPQWPAQFQQLVEVARYKQDCATGSRELAQHPMDVGRSAQVESARDIMRDQSAPYRDLESTSSFVKASSTPGLLSTCSTKLTACSAAIF